MLCTVQITILKHEKSHNKLIKINTRKILIYKLNNLAVWDSGVTLALVGWQVVGANCNGEVTGNIHKLSIRKRINSYNNPRTHQ